MEALLTHTPPQGFHFLRTTTASLAIGVLVIALASGVALMGVSATNAFFLLALVGQIIALMRGLRSGAFYALFYFAVKSALWRLAYHLDTSAGMQPSFDLLAPSGGLFLIVVCVLALVKGLMERKPFVRHPSEWALIGFITVNALSVLNPQISIFVGLAGFERNIFPTVFLYFVGREAIGTDVDMKTYVRLIFGFGALTAIYAIGHSFQGLWGFEKTFFVDAYNARGLNGWLTFGVRGLEFRPFSTFWSYTESTFTLALWTILALGAAGAWLGRRLRILRGICVTLMCGALIVALERTPLVMILVGVLVTAYIASDRMRRRRILMGALAVGVIGYSALTVFEGELAESGVAKLQRLSEMADPSEARSIHDRVERMWKPTLATIVTNPLGVGLGMGSQTIASGEAKAGSSSYIQPHNEFLQKALEGGWLSATLFSAILIGLFFRFKRKADTSDRKSDMAPRLCAVGCGVIAAFVLCGMVNLPFSGASGNFIWFTLGAIAGLSDNFGAGTERDINPTRYGGDAK